MGTGSNTVVITLRVMDSDLWCLCECLCPFFHNL